jgi:hypothetical protein
MRKAEADNAAQDYAVHVAARLIDACRSEGFSAAAGVGRVRGDLQELQELQELQLRMEGSSQAHEVRPLRSKTRSIMGTVAYTALAPSRFKDFWRE